MDLTRGDVGAIVWATGFRPDYSWLDVPVLNRKGQIMHEGGVVASPGLYAMGLPFMRRRKSTLMDGAGTDAVDLADHLVRHLVGEAAQGTAMARRAARGAGAECGQLSPCPTAARSGG